MGIRYNLIKKYAIRKIKKRGNVTMKLYKTDLDVTPICLGTANYGSTIPEAVAMREMYDYVELGGNFIDTAHVYGDWNPGDGPLSEITIGKWLSESKKRDEVIISTKGAHPDLRAMSIPRFSNQDIQQDLDASLKALQTDYVDLYFLHRDDPTRPVDEIIDFLEQKVKEGKIRYYGCSNWSLERIKEADSYAQKCNLQGFSCNQLMWSMADINFEGVRDKTSVLMDQPTYAYHKKQCKNAMAYMSTARGYFAIRMAGNPIPSYVNDMYQTPVNDQIFDLLREHVTEECNVTDYMLQYFWTQPFPAVPITSFLSKEHLVSTMHSLEVKCDEDVLKQIHAMRELR